MKKTLKIFAAILTVLVLAFFALASHLVPSQQPNRDASYRSRIARIWPEALVRSEAFNPVFLGRDWWVKTIQALFDNPFMKDGPYVAAYPASATNPATAVIVIPGGGYAMRSEKSEGQDIAYWLNDHCIAAFVLNYRLQRHPAPLADALRAIQFIRHNYKKYNIDPDKIGVMGFSAGGHLAATASTLYAQKFTSVNDDISQISARPDFSVLAYSVIDFKQFVNQGSLDNLLGASPSDELKQLLSPARQVTAETPPAFVWTSKEDARVMYQNSELYAKALADHGVHNELHLFAAGRHGSALAQDEEFAKAWPDLMLSWLHRENLLLNSGTSCHPSHGAG